MDVTDFAAEVFFETFDLMCRFFFVIIHGRSKNHNFRILINGGLKILNDEILPTLALKFKSNKILSPFWQKDKMPDLAHFGQFYFCQKGVKCYSI